MRAKAENKVKFKRETLQLLRLERLVDVVYLKAARDGNFELAAKYLDFRYLPDWMDESHGPQLAPQLKIALDKVLWFDLDLLSSHPAGLSDDDLPADRDSIGRIKTPEKTVDILMQRIRRGDSTYIKGGHFEEKT